MLSFILNRNLCLERQWKIYYNSISLGMDCKQGMVEAAAIFNHRPGGTSSYGSCRTVLRPTGHGCYQVRSATKLGLGLKRLWL